MTNKPLQNFVKFLIGIILLVIGVTLILCWWPDVVIIFRAMAGMGLALLGLLALYSIKK